MTIHKRAKPACTLPALTAFAPFTFAQLPASVPTSRVLMTLHSGGIKRQLYTARLFLIEFPDDAQAVEREFRGDLVDDGGMLADQRREATRSDDFDIRFVHGGADTCH